MLHCSSDIGPLADIPTVPPNVHYWGEAKTAFEARLHALARANRQLTETNWSGVSLTEIVRSELRPFAGRIFVEGIVISQAKTNALQFIWRETGGPPVARPAQYGFGTTLLKATFPDARIDYATEGVCCEIDMVLGSGHDPDQPSAS